MVATIDEYKKQYATALANKDAAGMKSANDGANAIRSQTGQKLEDASGHYNKIAAAAPKVEPKVAPKPGSQESHQSWINNPQSGQGGMDVYTSSQQDKFNQAVANSDRETVNALLADMNRVGYDLDISAVQGGGEVEQPVQLQQGGGYSEPQRPSFDSQAAMDKILAMLKGSADASFEAQKSQLDAALSNQLAQLEQSFAEAVQAGEMSVNEAKEQFEAQKKEIEQAAYQQSQTTKAYSNEMGIAQSQQTLGLQQGDNVRTNNMNDSNLSDRDKRLNDIKDRINLITQQKNSETARAQEQHGYGVAGARAQADAGYMNSLAGIMGQDYSAQQGFEHDYNMQQNQFNQADKTQDKAFSQEEKMQGNQFGHDTSMQNDRFSQENQMFDKNTKHAFDMLGKQLDNRLVEMSTQLGHDLTKMDADKLIKLDLMWQDNQNAIGKINLQGGIDLKKIGAQLAGQLQAIDREATHRSIATTKQNSTDLANWDRQNQEKRDFLVFQTNEQIKEVETKYKKQLEIDTRGVTPGTQEYKNIVAANDRDMNLTLKNGMSETLQGHAFNQLVNNPLYEKEIEMPGMWTFLKDKDPVGNYNKAVKEQYDLYQDINKHYESGGSGSGLVQPGANDMTEAMKRWLAK